MALDIFAQFATDETLEENGTWFQIGGGARVLVARSGNRKYGKMLTKEVERNKKALDLNDDAADKLSEEIMISVLAETILLGWEDISFKGEVLEYNVANAKKLLAVKDFRKAIAQFADDVSAFKFKETEEQGKA
mgnify:FL=1|jgi:hypothetical protein